MANYLVISKLCRVILAIFSLFYASTTVASVKDIEFRFSLLTALSKNSEVIEFYEENKFRPIWVGGDRFARDRRSYFFR